MLSFRAEVLTCLPIRSQSVINHAVCSVDRCLEVEFLIFHSALRDGCVKASPRNREDAYHLFARYLRCRPAVLLPGKPLCPCGVGTPFCGIGRRRSSKTSSSAPGIHTGVEDSRLLACSICKFCLGWRNGWLPPTLCVLLSTLGC